MSLMYFYSTGYNLNNRPFSRNALEEVLMYATGSNIELPQNYIYPNVLPVPQELGLELIENSCDYVKYSYPRQDEETGDINPNDVRYAFITAILPNATTNGFMVHIQEDIWTTYGLNMSGFNCKINGTIIRGHVNDWENGKATLKYTTDEAEEEILTDGLIFEQKKLDTDERYKLLYVLINAGNEYKTQTYNVLSINSGQSKYMSVYNLYVCGIDTQTSKLLGLRWRTYNTPDFEIENQTDNADIKDLNVVAGVDVGVSSTGIVAMWIGELTQPFNIYTVGNTAYLNYNEYNNSNIPQGSVTFNKNELIYSNKAKLMYTPNLTLTYLKFVDRGTYIYLDNVTTFSDNGGKATNYNDYISKGIVKLQSSIYNPSALNFEGTIISYEYSLLTSKYVHICVDPILQFLSLRIEQSNKIGYKSITYCPIHTHWEPLAHNSYWTQLNAKQSTTEARRSKVIGTVNYANSLVQGAVGVIGSAAGVGGTQNPDPRSRNPELNSMTAGAQFAGSVVDYVSNAVVGGINLATTYERADIQIQKNNSLIAGGIIQEGTYSQSGFYLHNSSLMTINGTLTEYMHDKIAKQLHRYGYKTQMHFDNDFLIKHQREKFNFVVAQDTVVRGLPLNYCRDIEDMFNKGVTLWTGSPQTYEVVNYPLVTG